MAKISPADAEIICLQEVIKNIVKRKKLEMCGKAEHIAHSVPQYCVILLQVIVKQKRPAIWRTCKECM